MGFLDRLEAKFKDGLTTGADECWTMDPVLTTVAPIDHALGGGFAYGRFTELYGNFASGKSALLYMAMAWNQRRGGLSILLDQEHAYDATFFKALGGDPSKLVLPNGPQFDSVEGVFGFIRDAAELSKTEEDQDEPKPVVIGWDSIAATPTKHLLEEGLDKVDLSRAKVISAGFQLVMAKIARAKLAVIAANQIRDKIKADRFQKGPFAEGNETHSPGGRSLRHSCTQRLELEYDGTEAKSTILEPETGRKIGRCIRGEVTKNRMAAPWGDFVVSFYTEAGAQHPRFDRKTVVGIDRDEALFDYYLNGRFSMPDGQRVILAKGAWYSLHSEIAPNEKSFHETDWPEKLERYPVLRSLLYDALEIDPELYAERLPESPTDGAV